MLFKHLKKKLKKYLKKLLIMQTGINIDDICLHGRLAMSGLIVYCFFMHQPDFNPCSIPLILMMKKIKQTR